MNFLVHFLVINKKNRPKTPLSEYHRTMFFLVKCHIIMSFPTYTDKSTLIFLQHVGARGYARENMAHERTQCKLARKNASVLYVNFTEPLSQ